LTLVLIIVGSVCCLIAVGLSIFLFVRSKNNNNNDDDYVARDMSTTHYQGLQVNEGGSLPQQGNSIYSDASLTDNGGEYNGASFAGSVDAYQNLQLSPLTNAYGDIARVPQSNGYESSSFQTQSSFNNDNTGTYSNFGKTIWFLRSFCGGQRH